MKFWKSYLITAIAFFGITTTVMLSSCEQDSCTSLKCQNGGSCAEGYCRCPTGFEGAECEIKSADRFVGLFTGYRTCTGYPPTPDSVEIFMDQEPVMIKLVMYNNKLDTFSGTVQGTHIEFLPVENGTYKRHITADFLNNKLKVYDDQIMDIEAGTRLVCSFIGEK